jgi:hypothetical protein
MRLTEASSGKLQNSPVAGVQKMRKVRFEQDKKCEKMLKNGCFWLDFGRFLTPI